MTDSSTPADAYEGVRACIDGITSAWNRGDADALHAFYHDGLIMRGPDFERAAVGREACVEGDRKFLESATIDALELGETEVDLIGNAAAASYVWNMTYTMEGTTYTDRGRDLFMLLFTDGRWQVVWRAMTLLPS